MLTVMFFIAAFIGIGASQIQSIDDCPAELPRNRYLQFYVDSCFLFEVVRERDYSHAERECEKNGGTLALVKSEEIQKFLTVQLTRTYHQRERVWIGLHDKVTEATWTWEDGALANYSNWAEGEGPNHFLGLSSDVEDCVAMDVRGQWHDYKCEEEGGTFFTVLSKNFICQYTGKNTPAVTAKPTTIASLIETTEKATTAQRAGTTEGASACPPFNCPTDCGLNGYKKDPQTGCSICECDV